MRDSKPGSRIVLQRISPSITHLISPEYRQRACQHCTSPYFRRSSQEDTASSNPDRRANVLIDFNGGFTAGRGGANRAKNWPGPWKRPWCRSLSCDWQYGPVQ
ncbi:hypothetical protein HYQ46_012884 [Verticillium longisporum]|nr:hypothetical protein HYQ44_008545 [Verticillium longisporum]KAG7151344.1 hypothetical protein HYQ46_012884 [Verticillium longisporum]